MSEDNEFITLSQIAERAGVQPSAVTNWRKRPSTASSFPKPVSDTDLRFRADEVDTWLRMHRPRRPRPARKSGKASVNGLLDRLHTSRGLPLDLCRLAATACLTVRHLDAQTTDPLRSAQRLEETGAAPAGALTSPIRNLIAADPDDGPEALTVINRWLADNPTQDTPGMFDELLGDLLHYGEPGQEDQLNRFLAGLLPSQAESLLDPAAGTGRLLAAADQRFGSARTVGYEINQDTWSLAVQRMLLNDLPATIFHANWFDQATPDKYDAVVTVPPMGLKARQPDPAIDFLRSWLPGKTITDLAFAWLASASDTLSPDGRAILVTDQGPLYRRGRGAAEARHELIRTGRVAAIIALPPGALAGTRNPAAAWILQAPTPTPQPILFIDNDGRSPAGRYLTAAADTHRSWRTDPAGYQPVPGLSAVVPVLDILTDDVPLTPATWTSVPTDPARVASQADQAYQHLNALIDARLQAQPMRFEPDPTSEPRLVALSALVNDGRLKTYRSRHIHRQDLHESGKHPVVTGITPDRFRIAGYLEEPPPNTELTRPGDVLVSLIGGLATTDTKGDLIPGASMLLIRPDPDDPTVDPLLLSHLINSPRVRQQAVGNVVARIRPSDITIPKLTNSEAVAAIQALQQLDELRTTAAAITESASTCMELLTKAIEAGVTITPPSQDKPVPQPTRPDPANTATSTTRPGALHV